MKLLESQWFLRMVDAAGKTPAARLLAIFSITANWIGAPGIREQFLRAYPAEHPAMHPCAALKESLGRIAAEAGAQNPAVLASQLVILLQGAIAEEMRNPGSAALQGFGGQVLHAGLRGSGLAKQHSSQYSSHASRAISPNEVSCKAAIKQAGLSISPKAWRKARF